ncbi:endonuclease [Marivita sp. XM-24bin2]|jgi:predicted flap endonuclease-1-like 5' DNA nuclease|uniref:endonuclease n=1 Tax=unclassified Marivita TaxID=2632480 RepID=UPI000D7A4975|nr:endonuclease [Marivita sp. XM-24bin2]MCR9107606.1 endonuclease [Paracoccaceae bacterium]PWL34869.1 MAG: endonuclease [Marivita sp. XM-24bin2]
MQQQNSGIGCQLGCWALAAGVGLLVFILLLVIGGWGGIGSIFMAGLAFVVLGAAFSFIFCRDLPAPRGPGNIDTSGARETTAAAPKAAAPKAASPNASPVSVPPAPTADESTSPAKAAPLASAPPAAAAAPAASDAQPDVHTASAKADAEAGAQVKPSTRLAGQEDLASRKGTWKYEAEQKAASSAAATPAGDGAAEGSEEGSKPETLSAAREGGPDNLKEIKGVGPKLEKLLNSMGFYHFDQIANWTPDEVAWVNANLEGFKGRVSRDNWVEQAKILAAGGETEFSKRVDDGDVY